MEAISSKALSAKEIYRMLWRWHFYAGVFAIPFVIILSITGAIYLFKPQIDAINDAPFRHLTITGQAAPADQQLAAALAAVPGSVFNAYELPRASTDAIQILVAKGNEKYRVYVHPHTLQILQIKNDKSGILKIAHDIHGELLLGKTGSVLVELAASWAIVLVLTGLYLWWPRNTKGMAGVLYPRLRLRGRLFWRDLHGVIGVWMSALVLFLLISGLPWALVWGSAFKELRQVTGAINQSQDWVIAGRHEEHTEHAEHLMSGSSAPELTALSLDRIVDQATQLHFAYPVIVLPPNRGSNKKSASWMKQSSTNWTVKSAAQNRPLRADAELNPYTGDVVSKTEFSQRHIIDRVIGIGVAAHEGQLFGWINQLLGLLVTLGLLVLSVSGFVMWRKRKPQGTLGAPPAIPDLRVGYGFMLITLIAALLLPVLACSLVVIFVLERFFLVRWLGARKWLGIC